MKRVLLSALALGAVTTAATAEPQEMTETELGDVAGGATGSVDERSSITQTAIAAALAFGEGSANASVGNFASLANSAAINGTETTTTGAPNGSASLGTP